MLNHVSIPFTQRIKTHLRTYVSCPVNIISGEKPDQTALLLHTLIKPCAWRGIEYAYHCRDYPAFLYKLDLPLEDGRSIIVKTHNKTSLHLKACPLHELDAFEQIPVSVLLFIAFSKAFLIGCFDADEDTIKTRFNHHVHQRPVICQIDCG